MRTILHPAVERGCIEGDHHGGVFVIPGPCGNKLSIIMSDGSDWHDAGLEGTSWEHVSVKAFGGQGWRVPNWKEMCFVKDMFWTEEECVVQYHPPKIDYVNDHAAVLHLWRCKDGFPTPPKVCV